MIADFEKRLKETSNGLLTGVIYCYTNIVNGKKYVGQTYREKDRIRQHKKMSYRNAKQYFHKAIRKYGWENFNYSVLCRKNYLNESDLHFDLDLMEILSIFKLDTTNHLIGYNIGFGGAGSNGNKGKKLSEETRKKISEAQKKVKHNKEWVDRVAEKHNKPVTQFSLNGEFINKYNSIKEAVLSVHNSASNGTLIGSVCNGKRKSAYGYLWKWDDETNYIIPYTSNVNRHKLNGNISVVQIDINNKIINKFYSIKEAAEITGCDNSTIIKCCRGKRKTTGGYMWKYAE